MKKKLTLEEFKAKLAKRAKKPAGGGCFKMAWWGDSPACVQSGECVTIKPPPEVFNAILYDMTHKAGKAR